MTDREQTLRDFYTDPGAVERMLVRADPAYVERACTFVHALGEFGIRQSRIHVEDFDTFSHFPLTALIDAFIEAAPYDELPLAAITVARHVRADSCVPDFDALIEGLRLHADAMARFAVRYNIEVVLEAHIQHFDAERALAVCELAATDALDSAGFFFDYSGLDESRVPALRDELARFSVELPARNPKVRVGNFPFCFFPAEAFKLVYRDAVEPLKGHIGAQRNLIHDLREKPFTRHEPCRSCRSRVPCYVYTDVAEHPDCAVCLAPRHESSLVFAGGSVSRDDVPPDADLVWAGPAEQGDMVAAVLEGFENILVIDGYFYTRFPCTTLEVMLALEYEVNVFGASSIGALRAVELDVWGMIGTGRVYEYLKKQEIKPYHIVAQTYDEVDRPLTTPLIQIVYFLVCASSDGVVTREEHEALRAAVDEIHFTFLSFESFFLKAASVGALPPEKVAVMREYYLAKGAAHFDIKKQDALELLTSFRSVAAGREPGDLHGAIRASARRYLGGLTGKYPVDQHFALPRDWRKKGAAVTSDASTRDRRACSAEQTCRNARRFLHGLGVILADTTRYDPADSYILNTIFVLFTLLDYYPSSATGNGDVFEEALASAYMELVERIPACALQVRGQPVAGVDEHLMLWDTPQVRNWGADDETKQRALEEHGCVQVTDIVSGGNLFVPGYGLMFRYSGTDGYAAGNTFVEAVLYGLYEVIERDTGQVHLQSAVCRELLPQLAIDKGRIADPRCRTLLAQAEEKGCEIILFDLPNPYGLPCVMCHVYDRNRRIQCHGGIAVRSDFTAAVYAALHEAYMQYITYFVGTRDDYRAFAPLKQARIAYEDAKALYFGEQGTLPAALGRAEFGSLRDELDFVVSALTTQDVTQILVADTSPRPEYDVKSVKVIVPGMELWFCPDYRPSPFLAERMRRTEERVREVVSNR
jgi:TfuA protein